MSKKESLKNLASTEDSDDEEDEDYVPENQTDDEDLEELKTNKRKLSEDSGDENVSKKDEIEPLKEEDKKKADELWANFLKDVKPSSVNSTDYAKKYQSQVETKKETPSIRPKTDFFGAQEIKKDDDTQKAEDNLIAENSVVNKDFQRKKPMGMAAILDKINNNEKLSTLVKRFESKFFEILFQIQEKSKIDWNEFKKDKKIEEDLATQVKGKNS